MSRDGFVQGDNFGSSVYATQLIFSSSSRLLTPQTAAEKCFLCLKTARYVSTRKCSPKYFLALSFWFILKGAYVCVCLCLWETVGRWCLSEFSLLLSCILSYTELFQSKGKNISITCSLAFRTWCFLPKALHPVYNEKKKERKGKTRKQSRA